jgi:putative transposase
MRNALAHVATKAARTEWRAVADRLRDRFRRLAELMDEAEDDVLAHACPGPRSGVAFPKEHWQQLHSTNSLERLNGEINRRTDVVAIFPNEDAGSSARCCSNRTTSGRCRAAT